MKVFLISQPKIDWNEFQKFVFDEELPIGNTYMVNPCSDAEVLSEIGGRLCYMSFGRGRSTTEAFIDNILAHEHFSVLEHANWSFLITGVSRSFTHELIRHRHFSYSQLSQRYVDQSGVELVVPEGIKIAGLEASLREALAPALAWYEKTLSFLGSEAMTTAQRKSVHTAARCALPNATETKIMVTGNARALREMIQKRNVEGTDPEIHAVAALMLEKLREVSPLFFSDLD